jgi:hypothetical protein
MRGEKLVVRMGLSVGNYHEHIGPVHESEGKEYRPMKQRRISAD